MYSASLTPVKPAGRVSRRPAHSFNLQTRPYQIQPCMIAPVLPGETLKNLLLQARVTTDPLVSPLTGWWSEFYFFYVKLRDLDGRDDFVEMLMSAGTDMSAYDETAATHFMHNGNGIPWTKLCLKRVVEEYFRDEGEAWDDFLIGNLPACSISSSSWMDSLRLGSDASDATDHELPGDNPVLPDHMTGFENHFTQWERMRSMKLTEASFDDWLRSFGVRAPKPETEDYVPELLRYVRDWQQPGTALDGSGTAGTVIRWSHAERADKDRYFKEPGFLLGVQIARPKVYLSTQTGSASSMLNDAFSFLPAILGEEPYTSLREFQTSTSQDGPLADTPSGAYWVDLRDLFLYGDQFVNHTSWSSVAGIDLPTAALQKRYATAAMVDTLFSSGAANQVHSDGVVSLNILGTQVDHT